MQFDTVEARLLCPLRRSGKERRQGPRQFRDVRQVHVGDPLAVALAQGFKIAFAEDGIEVAVGQPFQVLADRLFAPAIRAEPVADFIGDDQEAVEELCRIGPPAYGKEVDHLDEKLRAPAACPVHRLDQFFQPRQKTIVADTKKRTGRHVANAGRFDN